MRVTRVAWYCSAAPGLHGDSVGFSVEVFHTKRGYSGVVRVRGMVCAETLAYRTKAEAADRADELAASVVRNVIGTAVAS